MTVLRERVLIVDDELEAQKALVSILDREGYRCMTAGGIDAAHSILDRATFDLVVCDLGLPDGSGMQLLQELVVEPEQTAVLMMVSEDDTAVAQEAIDTGADGYVLKPFTKGEVLIGVVGALRAARVERSFDAVLRNEHEETIHRLAMTIDARDSNAGTHITQMSVYCWGIARALGLSDEYCDLIRNASQMHDIGKIIIPDTILGKRGSLTAEERLNMERHTEIGHRILAGSPSPLLQMAASIALAHHEWFDGSGYPFGRSGADIPLDGRIAAVADVFDALTRNRVYRPRVPLAEALAFMREHSGTQFDPDVLSAFLSVVKTLQQGPDMQG